MKDLKKTDGKQTVKGKFAPGNKIGKQFPKGISGNPSGRPKLTKLTDALREQISELNPGASEETIAEAIAAKLIKLALAGDIAAINAVFDRTEGKPKQAIDLDIQTTTWRDEAKKYGLSESEIIHETRILLAEFDVDSSDE